MLREKIPSQLIQHLETPVVFPAIKPSDRGFTVRSWETVSDLMFKLRRSKRQPEKMESCKLGCFLVSLLVFMQVSFMQRKERGGGAREIVYS